MMWAFNLQLWVQNYLQSNPHSSVFISKIGPHLDNYLAQFLYTNLRSGLWLNLTRLQAPYPCHIVESSHKHPHYVVEDILISNTSLNFQQNLQTLWATMSSRTWREEHATTNTRIQSTLRPSKVTRSEKRPFTWWF